MDKLEYRTKTEQMLSYMKKKSYKEAMDIADTIKWNKVKNVPMICSASEVYEYNKEYQISRDILFLAYDREPENKKIIFRLATLALKMNDIEEAMDCYKEFVSIAPEDPNQYVLKYMLIKRQGASLKEQIDVLKKLKEAEYIEKWAFQLALLYRETGMIAECIEECDDLIAWFSEGKYIYKAMELKRRYKPLTPLQQEKYNMRLATSKRKEKEVNMKELKAESEIVEETMEEKMEEKVETTLSIEEMLQEWEEKQKENAQLIREEIKKVEDEKSQEEVTEQPAEEILSKDVRELMEELETESADIEAQKIKTEEEPAEEVVEDKSLVQKVAEQLATLDIKEVLTPQPPVQEVANKTEETVAEFAAATNTIEEIEIHEESGGIKLGDTQSMAAVAKALKNDAEPAFQEVEEDNNEEVEKSPYDTGFIVKGRYDLEAQSEIGLKAGLTEEQKKLFSYFVPVHGMSEQLVNVLQRDKKCKSRYGTSRTGNLVIIGRKGSGKTVLAVDVVKAIQKGRKVKPGKVGIVTAEALNKKDVTEITKKLCGGAIIIERASRLSRQSIETLCEVMEGQTGEMLVVLEDQRKPLEKTLSTYPQFAKKFTSRLELPVFINDELVTFGQTYAKENGYKIDEMGILALYSKIDMLQRDEKVVTVTDVKEILDDAIENSQKASFKKFVKKLVGKTTDDSDRILLREEDFK